MTGPTQEPSSVAIPAERARTLGERLLPWYAFLGAPVAWAIHIGARYPLVPVACKRELPWLLHGTTVLCLAAAAGSAIAAAALCRRTPGRSRDPTGNRPRSSEATPGTRERFMATGGLVFSLLFGAVIVAELTPALLQDPCAGVRVGAE